MAQTIVPNLWFEGNADQAVDYYISLFPDSKIIEKSYYPKSSEEGLADFQLHLAGETLTVEFELGGHIFTAINAGPEFKFNPAISFMVNFDPSRDPNAREHLDALWKGLSEGGEVLMDLQAYPFSQHYGWVKDRFGLSWQLILTHQDGEPRPFIIPSLLFTRNQSQRAQAAGDYYTSVFDDAQKGTTVYYPDSAELSGSRAVMFSDFRLANLWFVAADAVDERDFVFNESVSFSLSCIDQREIDYYWSKLSHDPQFEQCGWCKDQFGISWQIVPANMADLMAKPDAFAHMMEMKKIVIADF